MKVKEILLGPSFEKQRITSKANHHPLIDLFGEINYALNYLCVSHFKEGKLGSVSIVFTGVEMKNKGKGMVFHGKNNSEYKIKLKHSMGVSGKITKTEITIVVSSPSI